MDESTNSDPNAFSSLAAAIGANAVSDEKIRLMGENTALQQDKKILAAALEEIATYARDGAASDALGAGFALGRIVAICENLADDDPAEEAGTDHPIY